MSAPVWAKLGARQIEFGGRKKEEGAREREKKFNKRQRKRESDFITSRRCLLWLLVEQVRKLWRVA